MKWIYIIDEINWETMQKKSIFAVSEKHVSIISKMESGDEVIIYLKPKRIVACYKILSINNESLIDWGDYIIQRKVEEIKISKNPVQLDSKIINELNYFRNKMWGGTLMGKALININDDDYIKLKSLL